MKRAILARPNLKLLVLAASCIALLAHWVANGQSYSSVQVPARVSGPSGELYLQALLQRAATKPSPDIYTRLSVIYEQRREFRRALFFLRQADALEDAQPALAER